MILTLDLETTTKNKGHPFTPGNFVCSYSYKVNDDPINFVYYTDPAFRTILKDLLRRVKVLVLFNGKFDLHWVHNLDIDLNPDTRIFDVSLAEFVLTGQQARMASLNDVLSDYGFESKYDKVKEYWELGIDTPDIPVEVLEEYNNYDVEGTYAIYEVQEQLLEKAQQSLVFLMGRDMCTLIQAERAGILFDQEKAKDTIRETNERIQETEKILSGYLPELPKGITFNWDSGDQLSAFLYGGTITYDYATETSATYQSGEKKGQNYVRRHWHTVQVSFQKKFIPLPNSEVEKTKGRSSGETHFYQTDEPTLKQLKCSTNEQKTLLKELFERAKLIKTVEMLQSILDKFSTLGWQDNLIHGQFNQNVAATGRLSSSNPNQQNFSPELKKLMGSRYT